MAEWLKAHAWKACLGETLTRVRIPLSPPNSLYEDEKSGISFPLNLFTVALATNLEKDKVIDKAWNNRLRGLGVKMAHPDDGSVNRDCNEISLVYPQFDDGVSIGDVIALGWPPKYRFVRMIGIRRSMFGTRYLQFEPS
jgi:hypothetical protein